MCDAQVHRGPDDDGYYANGPVSLGIRRLAIIDLTKGLYPLRNEEGTIHLVFNGEIYGFDELRTQLEEHGHRFLSRTDSETLVHCYEQWGTNCIKRLNGMFAFALWDEKKQLLWMARDHFGIKPLYYYRDSKRLAFASEIKPLLVRPDIRRHPNEHIISGYMKFAQVDDTEDTFFDGIKQLRPAHQLLVTPDGTVELRKYWSPPISARLNGPTSRAEVENTRRLFLEAIRRQLVSDVPVGTCLSGGIDSSSVVSAIGTVQPKPSGSAGEKVKTFSAVFPSHSIDESRYAKIVCEATKAEYNPVSPTANELWNDLPELVRCQEEPFASTSIYAQYRVMKHAKEKGVTVLLDGQGADELLCGYLPLYLHYLVMLTKQGKYRKLLTESVRSCDLVAPLVRPHFLGYVKRLLSFGRSLLLKPQVPGHGFGDPTKESEYALQIILDVLTTENGLPALLRYEDKNSMWHSIEARVPFLDLPFFEYVASLPLDRKLRDGWTKQVFRSAMSGILPEAIRLRRTKIGFETPEKTWIERDLRQHLRDFFSSSDLIASRFYDRDIVRKLLKKSALEEKETRSIWRALNLELWYRQFFGATSNCQLAEAGVEE
jgi:asparagine synthase (glutamine-hydrolysing)